MTPTRHAQDALARLVIDIAATSERMLLSQGSDPKAGDAVEVLEVLFDSWETSVKSLHPRPQFAMQDMSIEATQAYERAKVFVPRLRKIHAKDLAAN